MREGRVHIGIEAVFAALQRLPQAHRLFVGEGDALDALGRFEAVFPWQGDAERCAVLLGHRFPVNAGRDESELVGGLFDGEAFDIGPRIDRID